MKLNLFFNNILYKINKLMLIVWIGILFFVQGCAVAKQVTGPDGKPMYTIDCSGVYLNSGHCLEKAGKVCGEAGYEIIGGYGNNHGNMTSAGSYGLFSTPVITRELWVRCKGAPVGASSPVANADRNDQW